MDLGLNDRVVVVMGASGVLGSAIATTLGLEGASVVLAGRDRAKLGALQVRLANRGVTTLVAVADTTDQASVDALAENVQERFGRVDVLVNAAAAPALSKPDARLSDTSAADILEDFQVKVLGAFRTIQALVPLMSEGGHVVSISGLNARRTGALSGSIRNVALAALTKNLADELGPQGINLTVVHPGVVDSPAARARLARRAETSGTTADALIADLASQSSLHRLATPEDIANVVVFLASERSAAITGDSIAAAGGERGVIHY
jgi:NAD(P)-dependent dehydrogenase (short-subunit alcohol dehydrogenase family)